MSDLLHKFFLGLVFSFELHSAIKICSSQILGFSLIAVSLSNIKMTLTEYLMAPSWAASMESVSGPELLILSHFYLNLCFPCL